MFVALDGNDQRVYADTIDKESACFCPSCGETLRVRKGTKKRAHFAHLPQTECKYARDKDAKSEWHIRMQDYFPREVQEVRFINEQTGEIHIADVFIENINTVIEFQHSPISEEEFLSRTKFHLNSGRRIAWFFDESSQSNNSTFGRFKSNGMAWFGKYDDYHWMRMPRAFLSKGPDIEEEFYRYAIFVYTGTEGDVFHRIVDELYEFEDVRFSTKIVDMSDFNVDTFFEFDEYWSVKTRERKQLEKYHYNYFRIPLKERLKNQRKFRF